MNIAVIGTGYVGLTTGTCLAEMGNNVTCVDIDVDKIASLNRGEVPIFEPGLETYFARGVADGRLRFTSTLADALDRSEIIFLALPTPSAPDGSADLGYLLRAAGDIASHLSACKASRYRVIVNKSTVPVGTTNRLKEILVSVGLQPGEDVDVVSNPEFLREGSAVSDFLKPDRVVVGSSSAKATAIMKQLYEPFVRQGNPILIMDEPSAELTKYAANALLASRIAFINEIASLCERMGADVEHVRRGVGSDQRIGHHFLYAGIGFGGSCFPKDVRALRHAAHLHGCEFQMLDTILSVNARQQLTICRRLRERFESNLSGKRIALWGLSFKPNTDDVREAPSHVILRDLVERGASICAFDPVAIPATKSVLGNSIEYAPTAYDALDGADALVICTEWNEFRRPDLDDMIERMARPIIFDGRNLYTPSEMAKRGFEYYSIGRPSVQPETPLGRLSTPSELAGQISPLANGKPESIRS